MRNDLEEWSGSRRELFGTAAKNAGLHLLTDAAKVTVGVGIAASVVIIVLKIDSALETLHHNAAVRDAEALTKLQDEFANAPQVQLSFLGEFPSTDAVQGLAANTFFTSIDANTEDDAIKKTVYVITDDEYQEITKYNDDGMNDRFVLLDFADDTTFFEDFNYDYTVQRAQDAFKEHIDPAFANKQVLAITVSAGRYTDQKALDTLLSSGFNILYGEGTESVGYGGTLGIKQIQDGTQRVYNVPPFTQ